MQNGMIIAKDEGQKKINNGVAMVDFVCLAMPQSQFDMIVGLEVADNTSY